MENTKIDINTIQYTEAIDTKWNKIWEEEQIYKFDPKSNKPKLYLLEMFSYPSGAKLHIGHWWNYSLPDSWGRMKRMQGYQVFHPMGFDAFGLPAENYAIKTNIHPKDSTEKNISVMENQLKALGGTYDWDYEVKTCEPEYYRWTQWIFLKLFEKGLAYKKKAPVNWCPDCKTVLANEQAKEGHCERCGSAVIQKELSQWFFKITDYADELLDGIDELEWPEKTKKIQKEWIGKKDNTYRLHDWLVSRQRYWGAPIPIIYCEKCGIVPVQEDKLPVKLPATALFKPDGDSPLASCEEFINTTCPVCGGKAKRESDTLDTFVCSSWYYLRHCDPHNANQAWDINKTDKLAPVDKYVGGIEHAAMHLLYARFIYKAMRDMGYVHGDEPFLSLTHQGIVLGADGQKMSKSKGNTIVADEYIKRYGSDVFRTYLAFGFSYEEGGPWSDQGIIAIKAFFDKVAAMYENYRKVDIENENTIAMIELQKYEKELDIMKHRTIKAVTRDVEIFHFNTAVARLMELRSAIAKYQSLKTRKIIFERDILIDFLKMFSIFAPHYAEEIWYGMGNADSVFNQQWPTFEEAKTEGEQVEIIVQINSKNKIRIWIDKTWGEDKVRENIMERSDITKMLHDKSIKKVIYVKNRLVNIII